MTLISSLLGQGKPDAKYFRNSGFPLYDKLAEIVEGTVADGRHVVSLGKRRRRNDSDDEEDSAAAPGEPDSDSEEAEEAGSSQPESVSS